MNLWESVFTQSPANDGYYDEDDLPHLRWAWPKSTWFQARRDFLKEHKQLVAANTARKMAKAYEMPTL